MRGDGGIYKRGRFYWLDYTGPDHVRHQESAKTSDEDLALKKLQALRKRVDAGIALTPKQRRVTVDDLLNDLQTHLEVNKKASAYTVSCHLVAVREAIGSLPASALDTAIVERCQKEWIKEKKAAATINRRCEALRQAYRLAASRTPPKVRIVPKIPLLTVDNARQGFLSRADFLALLAEVRERDVDVADFLEWFFWTSQRPGEIRQLEWSHYDVETKTLHIPPTIAKTRTGRSIPIAGPLEQILKRRRARRTPAAPLIFHRTAHGRAAQPIGNYEELWQNACEASGLVSGRSKAGGVTPYDLRRTALRNIVRATGSERAAMAYSGHKTRRTFDRYNIQSEDDKREAMALTEEYVRKLPTRRKVALHHHK